MNAGENLKATKLHFQEYLVKILKIESAILDVFYE